MPNKKSNVNNPSPNSKIEGGGNYIGLARVAVEIAEEKSRQLDEIERLLDAGENDAAIALMRKYMRSPRKKPPMGVGNESTGKQGAVA